MGVFLGNINAGSLSTGFVESRDQAMRPVAGLPPVIAESYFHISGPYLDDARNNVVEVFMQESKQDILLFVDSDILFTPKHVTDLVKYVTPSRPVVGGTYFSVFKTNKDPVVEPVAYKLDSTSVRLFRRLTKPEVVRKSIIRVDAVGTGFMAIHRSLLESMKEVWLAPQHYFAENTVNGVHLGEDLTFCLRVQQMGHPIILHRGVRPTHIKNVGLGG